jgi:3-methyladenine DNA glycosylase AlkD
MYLKILKELKDKRIPRKDEILSRFFKTGNGEYGEGDRFLGVNVPEIRAIAKKYKDIDFSIIEKFLCDKYHEVRLLALIILVYKFISLKGTSVKKQKKEIFDFYLKNIKYVNNWDLVDLSCYHILGEYLLENPSQTEVLFRFSKSNNMWERRISIVATFAFIKKGQYEISFKIIKSLLEDKNDLIQKACGWMLREIGKRINEEILIEFLNKNISKMSRTTLRYAIERFEYSKRQYYLNL